MDAEWLRHVARTTATPSPGQPLPIRCAAAERPPIPSGQPAGNAAANAVTLASHIEADDTGSVQVDVYAPLCVDGDHVMTAWTGYGPPPLVAPVPVDQTATPAGAEKRTSVALGRTTLTCEESRPHGWEGYVACRMLKAAGKKGQA